MNIDRNNAPPMEEDVLKVDPSKTNWRHRATVDWEKYDGRYVFQVPDSPQRALSSFNYDPVFHFAVKTFSTEKSIHPRMVIGKYRGMQIHINNNLVCGKSAPGELNRSHEGKYTTVDRNISQIEKATRSRIKRSMGPSTTEKFTQKVRTLFRHF